MEADKHLVDKHSFEEKLITLIGKNSGNNFTTALTTEQYTNILNEIKNSIRKRELNEKLSSQDYRRLNRFEIIKIGENENIIAKRENDDLGLIRYYCKVSEVHGILEKAHRNTGHKRRLGMEKEIAKKYCNVPRSIIEEYLKLCAMCELKKKSKQKGLVVKPIISTGFNKRGQIDLIDMQTEPDGPYKFIMNYQDLLTKFVFLRALKTKRAEEVAYNLMDIFCITGAPCLLHSNNGREFVNKIIDSLADMFQAKIIHGKPCQSQSQGSIERANQDVRDILITWMQETQSSKWSEGLRFVQLKKNQSFHSGIQCTPYEAMFGTRLINGLTDSNLPLEIVERLQDEEDIYRLPTTVSENIEDTLSDQSDTKLLSNDKDADGSSSNLTNNRYAQPISEPENDEAQDHLLSGPNLTLKQEFYPPETFVDVKTELTDEYMYDEYADKPELFDIQSIEQDSYPHESEIQFTKSQAHEKYIQKLDLNETVPVEENTVPISPSLLHSNDNPKATLICKICGYRTQHNGHMRVHNIRHNQTYNLLATSKFFECEDCEYVTKNKTNLKLHSKRHEKEKEFERMPEQFKITNFRKPPYQMYSKRGKYREKPEEVKELQCPDCNYKTVKTGHFRLHIARHKNKEKRETGEPRIFTCDICDYQTNRVNNLYMHKYKHKKKIKEREFPTMPEECKIMDFPKPPYQMYSEQTRTNHEKPEEIKELQCPDCDYKTVKPGHFRFHVIGHRNRENRKKEEPQLFVCEICGYQTNNSSTFSVHKYKHKEEKEGPRVCICEICGYQTDRSTSLSIHRYNKHKEKIEGSYQCNGCDFVATNKRQLANHKYKKHKKREGTSETRNSGEMLECDFCDYKSFKYHLFSIHLKTHSFTLGKDDTYNCSNCEFRTAKNITLKVHMAREHNITPDSIPMRKCEDCSYETLNSGDLKKHLLIHKPPEEVEMAKCPECSYETLHKSNLNIHIKRRHRTVDQLEMFECFHCGYKARFKSLLKEHLTIHQDPSSLNMHKCPECDYETRIKKNLRRHIQRRHRKDDQSFIEILKTY